MECEPMTTTMSMPRMEYPRPQFVRKDWTCLNGEWEFEFDDERVGDDEMWYMADKAFSKRIQVPFAFQSKLSGIGDTDFHDVVWYRRAISIPEAWSGKRVLLHFGAVDYSASVWVNGHLAVTHEGGHTPFSADITALLRNESNVIVVKAQDYSQDLSLPRGKQYWKRQSGGIFYTRTTGIWQSVWLEPVDAVRLDKVKLTPDIDNSEIEVQAFIAGFKRTSDIRLDIRISFKGELITEDTVRILAEEEQRSIKLHGITHQGIVQLWSPEQPNLYDVQFVLKADGAVVDTVDSYFGMRKISVEEGRLSLNNKPYFMRLVLDQGYFEGGNLTPPSDEAIVCDVELTKAMGFNGARKHQKVEDPRYLYWCDRMGLLVWGEMANSNQMTDKYIRRFVNEWQDAVERDYNHPCIVVWVPINESWGVPHIQRNPREQQHAMSMYHLIKSFDSSRLVISNDGWEHMISDLCTVHDYQWRREVLEKRYSSLENVLESRPNRGTRNIFVKEDGYTGQPVLVTEFGGISLNKSEWEGWGHSAAENEEDFVARLEAVVQPLLQSPVVQGFCYTQLTDTEQEINGMVTFDRQPKVELEKIRDVIAGPSFMQMEHNVVHRFGNKMR
jgi:beta-galactosidase/beta-glucuronidase